VERQEGGVVCFFFFVVNRPHVDHIAERIDLVLFRSAAGAERLFLPVAKTS